MRLKVVNPSAAKNIKKENQNVANAARALICLKKLLKYRNIALGSGLEFSNEEAIRISKVWECRYSVILCHKYLLNNWNSFDLYNNKNWCVMDLSFDAGHIMRTSLF